MMAESLGVLPETAFREALAAPYGKAIQIIQKYDPLWGACKKYPGRDLKRYNVYCRQRKTVEQYCNVEVEAYCDAHVQEIVRRMPDKEFDWIDDDEDTEDFDITSIDEVTTQ